MPYNTQRYSEFVGGRCRAPDQIWGLNPLWQLWRCSDVRMCVSAWRGIDFVHPWLFPEHLQKLTIFMDLHVYVCVLMSHSKTQLSIYFINPADCCCYWQQMVGDFLISPSRVYFQLSLYFVQKLLNSAALFFPVSWLYFIFISHFQTFYLHWKLHTKSKSSHLRKENMALKLKYFKNSFPSWPSERVWEADCHRWHHSVL